MTTSVVISFAAVESSGPPRITLESTQRISMLDYDRVDQVGCESAAPLNIWCKCAINCRRWEIRCPNIIIGLRHKSINNQPPTSTNAQMGRRNFHSNIPYVYDLRVDCMRTSNGKSRKFLARQISSHVYVHVYEGWPTISKA